MSEPTILGLRYIPRPDDAEPLLDPTGQIGSMNIYKNVPVVITLTADKDGTFHLPEGIAISDLEELWTN